METLPILNTPVPQTMERTDKDQRSAETDDTAAASLGFGGMLQQAFAATAPPIAAQEGQGVQQSSVSEDGQLMPAAGVISAQVSTPMQAPPVAGTQVLTPMQSGMLGEPQVSTPIQVTSLTGTQVPAVTQGSSGVSTQASLPAQGASDVREAMFAIEQMGLPSLLSQFPEALSSGLPQSGDQLKPSAATPSTSPAEAPDASAGAVTVDVRTAQPQLNTGREMNADLARLSSSLDALNLDPSTSTTKARAEGMTLTSFVRRQQTNTVSTKTPVQSQASTNLAGDKKLVEDSKGFTSAPAPDDIRMDARGIREGEKTVPLRMLLQRETAIISPESTRQEIRARIVTTNTISSRTDDRQIPAQSSQTSINPTPRPTERSPETPSVSQVAVPTVSGKSSPDTQDSASQRSDQKEEPQASPIKPDEPVIKTDSLKMPQTMEIRPGVADRSAGLDTGKAFLPLSSTDGTARVTVRTPLATGTMFDSTGSLIPELRTNLVGQVVKEIALQVRGQVSEMRMRLEPDTLGEVVLKVRMENGNMHAQIDVQQAAVKAVLDTSLPQLRQALVERGIDVQRLDVSCDGKPSSRESTREEGDRKKGTGHRRQEGVDAVEQYQTGKLMGYNTLEIVM